MPEQVFVAAFSVLARITNDPVGAAAFVQWVLYRALAARSIPLAISYYRRAFQNAVSGRDWKFPDYGDDTFGPLFLDDAESRLLKICPAARPLIQEIYASPLYRSAVQGRGL
jgi:hypothetical protein